MIKERNLDPGLVAELMFIGRDAGISRGAVGPVRYVDGNIGGSQEGDGLTWDTAKSTLVTGITAVDDEMGASANRNWAKRGTLYISGDWFVEDLVAFPEKTDIVGIGSADGFKGAGVTGNHAPVASTFGARFFNINFRPTAAADIITLTSACLANEFIGCRFHAAGTLTAVSAIDATASNFLKIVGCDFTGSFSGDVIDIGAGAIDDLRILDNMIMGGANDGIIVTGTATVTGGRVGLIARNYINVNNVVIDDGADSVILVMDNWGVTAAVLGATSHVITAEFGARNIITGNGVCESFPELDA